MPVKWFEILTFDLTSDQKKLLFRVSWRLLLMFHVAWACGLFSFIGLQGFLQASDMDNEVKPIKQELVQQRLFLEQMSKALTDSLAAGVASDIRVKIARRCKEKDRLERERLNKEIDKLQDQYVEYKTIRYPEPNCDEL